LRPTGCLVNFSNFIETTFILFKIRDNSEVTRLLAGRSGFEVEIFWVVTPCSAVVSRSRHSTTRRHNPEDIDLKHRRENLNTRTGIRFSAGVGNFVYSPLRQVRLWGPSSILCNG